jgi:hypothetical protein
MKTGKKLKYASRFLKLIMTFQIVVILGLAFVYFHSMVNPDSYKTLTVNSYRELNFNFNVEKVPETYAEWEKSMQLVHYNLLDNSSKFSVIWIKIITIIGFLLIVYYFDKFLKNTKNTKLFFTSNIKKLNQITLIVSSLFLFSLLTNVFTWEPITMIFKNGETPHYYVTKGKLSLDFMLYYPLTIIFFIILKEVFKRGQELKQENELTI